ncbi:MAG: DUF2232 domain-containing protein [Bacillota bacterium]|nr:DUF2232 domain-containing protein [Bacillota bacterium]
MNVRTNQVTQGAMYCALYGLLLFFNQQLGLIVETSLPCLFSLPILVCSAKSEKNISWIVALSMGLMTLLFGAFTTWFYSWTAILIGFLYGLGIRKKWSMMKNFVFCTILSIMTNFLIIFVWAKIFDMELFEEYKMIQTYLPYVSLQTFMAAFALILGLLEGLCVHFMGILLLRKLRVDMVPMKSIFEIKSTIYPALASILIWGLYYFSANVLECSQEVVGLLQLLWLMCYFILDFYGVIVLLSLCVIFQKRKLAFLATLGAMIPGIQWIWVLIGFIDCLFHIREKIFKRITL